MFLHITIEMNGDLFVWVDINTSYILTHLILHNSYSFILIHTRHKFHLFKPLTASLISSRSDVVLNQASGQNQMPMHRKDPNMLQECHKSSSAR